MKAMLMLKRWISIRLHDITLPVLSKWVIEIYILFFFNATLKLVHLFLKHQCISVATKQALLM